MIKACVERGIWPGASRCKVPPTAEALERSGLLAFEGCEFPIMPCYETGAKALGLTSVPPEHKADEQDRSDQPGHSDRPGEQGHISRG